MYGDRGLSSFFLIYEAESRSVGFQLHTRPIQWKTQTQCYGVRAEHIHDVERSQLVCCFDKLTPCRPNYSHLPAWTKFAC